MQVAVTAGERLPPDIIIETHAAERARIEVLDDMRTAEPFWRRLEAEHALATPFQRFDWVEAWQRHVGAVEGYQPFIVIGMDAAGAPLFLLPFVYRPAATLAVARFPGDDHSSLNIGLWRHDAACGTAAQHLQHDLGVAARSRGIDLYALLRQPPRWQGVANPMAHLSRQDSVDDVYSVTFPPGNGEDVVKALLTKTMRSRLRNKERKLQKLAGYRYLCAAKPAEVDRILEAFFLQKAAHLAVQGIHNVFADPGTAEFIRACCLDGLAEGTPLIELHAIEGGGEVIAVMGGVADDYQFSCMFNSYTLSENGHWSPGLILMVHLLTRCVDRGLARFDLGAGYAGYKSFFCRESEGLFDSFLPVSWRGQAAAPLLRVLYAARRRIKASPACLGVLQKLRRHLNGQAASGCGDTSGDFTSTTKSP
jgi:CelD/BcsL family acetyltransferase involved in cellulose biosynthesis